MTLKQEEKDPQVIAAHPARSAWVAASAGTGKTKVLVDRLLNLLLAGTAPSRLLCLTFTKAAAKEMTLRLAKQLKDWATASDDRLADDLRLLTGERADSKKCAVARRLFAQVIDAPGGLRIDTIHAFCQSLLGRFPIEARLHPNFRVLDERSAAELVAEARDALLNKATTDLALSEALIAVTARTGELGFGETMDTLVAERSKLNALLLRHGGVAGLERATRAALNVAPADTVESVERLVRRDPGDAANLRRAADAMLNSSSTQDRKQAARIDAWLADPNARVAGWPDYRGAYFTDKGERRKSLVTQQTLKVAPGLDAILDREADRVEALDRHLRAVRLVEATRAVILLGREILTHYEASKVARGALDYDDLVINARDLLRRPNVADWVLYKLDGGIDHILVDEAQDTNPEQWEVVQALAEEFFAGEGARDDKRTVFAVGDAKQSIFSFQRADPAAFARMRAHFEGRARDASRGWSTVELNRSFRSVPAVLQAVDAVIAPWVEREWRDLEGKPLRHVSHRNEEAGLVEVWPPVVPEEDEAPEPWAPPVERVSSTPAPARLAGLIAATIRGWLDNGERLESAGRPIHPGDILVLVRRRNAFVDDLVRALKEARIAVAGVDRMVLTEQLAIMDLVALGRFLLLPDDDLTLATVLKGPLIGWTEEQLFELAYDRKGTLWNELKARADASLAHAAAHRDLAALLDRADFAAPYELYADILSARRGRARLLARLGEEADDPIDEFLAAALVYERDHEPSLEGFLHWLERGAQEIKRDADIAEPRAVRIMTVHGAKGLQAPIVFMPDTLQVPRETRTLLWRDDLVLWSPSGAHDDPVAKAIRGAGTAADNAEQRRLLYVAMTRASDRLYVCGYQGRNNWPKECWYQHIKFGLEGVAASFTHVDPQTGTARGDGLQLVSRQTKAAAAGTRAAAAAVEPVVMPAWWGRPAPAESRPPRPLVPSAPEGVEPPVRSPLGSDDDGARFKRGRLIHYLLQVLPELPAADRHAAARRWLARRSHGLAAEAVEAIATETLAVLSHPDFAALFGPDSVAEVAVVGRVGERIVSGQIDRLVVTPSAVLIVDFKTNRPPPTVLADVPPIYRAQLEAYRKVLTPIYPGKEIRTALLWTDGPSLLWVPPGEPA